MASDCGAGGDIEGSERSGVSSSGGGPGETPSASSAGVLVVGTFSCNNKKPKKKIVKKVMSKNSVSDLPGKCRLLLLLSRRALAS